MLRQPYYAKYVYNEEKMEKKHMVYMQGNVKNRLITFTKAPMTPKLVSLRYSKGLDLLVVLRKGQRYKGIWAEKDKILV